MSKPFYATRDFKDSGSGKRFAKDDPVNVTAGELGNYKAAGLVTDETPKSTTKTATASIVATA